MADRKIIEHPLRLLEIVIEKITCRRLGDLNGNARPVIDIMLKGKTISNSEVYSYLTIKVSFAEGPKPFYLEATIRGKFGAPKPGNRSKLKKFAEKKTIIVLLPWAREVVANLTQQMGFPPLYLPLIDAEEMVRSVEEKIEAQREKP